MFKQYQPTQFSDGFLSVILSHYSCLFTSKKGQQQIRQSYMSKRTSNS